MWGGEGEEREGKGEEGKGRREEGKRMRGREEDEGKGREEGEGREEDRRAAATLINGNMSMQDTNPHYSHGVNMTGFSSCQHL